MESATQFLLQNYGHLTSYDSNVAKLKTEVKKLEAEKADMQTKVRDAERKGEVISERVKNWLGRVDEIIDRSKGLTKEEGHQGVIAGSSSSQTNQEDVIAGSGSSQTNQEVIAAGSNNQTNEGHPSGKSRWRLPLVDTGLAKVGCLKQSKEAEEMAQKVSEIIAEGRSFQTTDISFCGSPQMTTSSFARGYKAMGSRTSLLEKIKEALKDPTIYMVGVHGMGGVGKTTLMEELAYQAKQEELFGAVVMVTVTKTSDMTKVLDHLAERLRLEFKSSTEEVRAGELRVRIQNEKSILVILDDVWDKVDLTKLGVPYGDDHKGCKLVVTSRERDVLTKEMSTQKCFSLDALPDEESWDLFQKTVGDDVLKCHRIESIAREVAKCCAGLPLSIVIVAKSLKGVDELPVWEDSLTTLKANRGGEIDQEVIDRLRFSYDRLKSKELKSLFLLIGSLGQCSTGVYNDNEFFSICWGLGIYQNVSNLAEARNRHYRLIKDLRSSSLLLEGGTDRGLWERNCIRDMDRLFIASIKRPTLEILSMHDRVRDMARSVAYDKHSTFVLEKLTDINEWLKEDLQNCHHIILPRYAIGELPEQLDCPELELLLLHYEGSSSCDLSVLDNFFSGKGKVKVLQFHLIILKAPSPFFGLLKNLLSLTLYKSELEDINILGELTSLEILIIQV